MTPAGASACSTPPCCARSCGEASRLHQGVPRAPGPRERAVSDTARATVLNDLGELEASGADIADPVTIRRRDEREDLLAGHLLNELSGVAPTERLGPFTAFGSENIWYDVFFTSQRLEIREPGIGSPALVLTSGGARRRRRRARGDHRRDRLGPGRSHRPCPSAIGLRRDQGHGWVARSGGTGHRRRRRGHARRSARRHAEGGVRPYASRRCRAPAAARSTSMPRRLTPSRSASRPERRPPTRNRAPSPHGDRTSISPRHRGHGHTCRAFSSQSSTIRSFHRNSTHNSCRPLWSDSAVPMWWMAGWAFRW